MAYSDLIVNYTDSLSSVFTLMSQSMKRLYLVFLTVNCLRGISIGDIQRAIIANIPMDVPVSKVMRREYTFCNTVNQSEAEIKYEMLKHRMEFMPVIDGEGNFCERLFSGKDIIEKPVVTCRLSFRFTCCHYGWWTRNSLETINKCTSQTAYISEKTILEDIIGSIRGVWI